MDIHFPKGGAESCLDFGLVKVYEERVLTCTLKNKGRHDVKYRFRLDSNMIREVGRRACGGAWRQHSQHAAPQAVRIDPPEGLLKPSDKPATVRFVFRSGMEFELRNSHDVKVCAHTRARACVRGFVCERSAWLVVSAARGGDG